MGKGDISFSDFQCDTGLVIGLGLYTHTEMTWHEDTTYAISHFVAGAELADTNTDSLSYPYNPATSKAVHVVWSYVQDDYDKTFVTKMTNRPKTVDLQCVIGVDGVETDSDFGDYDADNTVCNEKFLAVRERSEVATANMMHAVSTRSRSATRTHLKSVQHRDGTSDLARRSGGALRSFTFCTLFLLFYSAFILNVHQFLFVHFVCLFSGLLLFRLRFRLLFTQI